MKKFIAVLLMLLMVTSVFAGKKFRRLGRYTDVEIIKVTARGIHISHADGISIITDRGLSARDRKNLSAELARYRSLKNAKDAVAGKKSQQQTQTLAELMKKLPNMSSDEIDAWVKKYFKIRLDDKNFRIAFNNVFAYADNKDACHNALIARAVAAQQEDVDALLNKIRKSSLEEAHDICRRMFGRPLNDPMFRRNFEDRFYMIKDHNDFFREADSVIARLEEERRREIARQRAEEERRRQEEERRRRQQLATQYNTEIMREFVYLANNCTRGSDEFLRRLANLKERVNFVKSNLSVSRAHYNFLDTLGRVCTRASHYFGYLNLASQYNSYQNYNKAQEMINDAKEAQYDTREWFNNCVKLYNNL